MSQNMIKILLATDNHLGYMEKDPIRGQDSFLAFEEILQIANQEEVDMILLGGDLFHDNKPSRKTLFQTMELLRAYTFGDRPSQLQYLSDPSINFSSKFANVNYQDPNINVSYPIFAIHGNHDDPSGDNYLSAMDLLSVSGFINFFGKVRDVDDITVYPVLLSKGSTFLALYGIGSIRDERLYRSFQRKKVKMLRPEEHPDQWFNLLLFHQNRASHSPTNYIPEHFLENFIHFVLWGHEHECLIDPQFVPHKNFHICQPGSSVATSLSEGESKPKHVAILQVEGLKYKIRKIPLKFCRPFLLKEISLSDYKQLRHLDMKQLNRFLVEQVDEMLLNSQNILEKKLKECPELTKPLVRLKVDYSGGFLCLNIQRFGQQFVDKVANPKDILLFYRKRSSTNVKEKRKLLEEEEQSSLRLRNMDSEDHANVEELISDFLEVQRLDLLPENEFGDAVRIFVDKDDRDAIEKFVLGSLSKIRNTLKIKGAVREEKIKEEIDKEKLSLEENWSRKKGGLKKESKNLVQDDRPFNSSEKESVADTDIDMLDEDELLSSEGDESLKETEQKTNQQKSYKDGEDESDETEILNVVAHTGRVSVESNSDSDIDDEKEHELTRTDPKNRRKATEIHESSPVDGHDKKGILSQNPHEGFDSSSRKEKRGRRGGGVGRGRGRGKKSSSTKSSSTSRGRSQRDALELYSASQRMDLTDLEEPFEEEED